MERLLPLRLGGVLGLGRCAVPALIQRRNKYLESVTIRYSPCWRTRSRSSLLCNASSGGSSSSSSLGLFPAGKKQAKVVIPALFITVGADEVMESNAVLEDLAAAVYGGATAVVLYESATGGASELYEASLLVKELLRGRAALIIADRTDIAPAVEADGALLSPQGLPTVVAKRNMGDGLLLVGRTVASADAAVQAAKEGANYVILQVGDPAAGLCLRACDASLGGCQTDSQPCGPGVLEAGPPRWVPSCLGRPAPGAYPRPGPEVGQDMRPHGDGCKVKAFTDCQTAPACGPSRFGNPSSGPTMRCLLSPMLRSAC